jgi:hypothetical protein
MCGRKLENHFLIHRTAHYVIEKIFKNIRKKNKKIIYSESSKAK